MSDTPRRKSPPPPSADTRKVIGGVTEGGQAATKQQISNPFYDLGEETTFIYLAVVMYPMKGAPILRRTDHHLGVSCLSWE